MRIVSGMQSSGPLHLANYYGAGSNASSRKALHARERSLRRSSGVPGRPRVC